MSTQNRWYVPQTAREAVDAVENCRTIIHFLTDNITQEGLKPGSGYSLTEDGTCGLYQIYNIIENVLDISFNILVKKEG